MIRNMLAVVALAGSNTIASAHGAAEFHIHDYTIAAIAFVAIFAAVIFKWKSGRLPRS